jgi:hypothetical protein
MARALLWVLRIFSRRYSKNVTILFRTSPAGKFSGAKGASILADPDRFDCVSARFCSAVVILESRSLSDGFKGVQTGPGVTALTRMPRGTRCVASDRVKAWMPPLVHNELLRSLFEARGTSHLGSRRRSI